MRDGLARVAPNQADVEFRDLFAEAYGPVNEFVRRGYLALVNFAPRAWGIVYRWVRSQGQITTQDFGDSSDLRDHLAPARPFSPEHRRLLFPGIAQIALRRFWDPERSCKCVVVVTDSITINATWYRSPADYFSLRTNRAPPSCERSE